MAAIDDEGTPRPVKFSDTLSSVWMHRERAMAEAIMVGANTAAIDKPRLDVRLWSGKNPVRIECGTNENLPDLMKRLKADGITSLMVEGGPTLLRSFIREGLFDEIRIESSPVVLGQGLAAPELPLADGNALKTATREICRGNTITVFRR